MVEGVDCALSSTVVLRRKAPQHLLLLCKVPLRSSAGSSALLKVISVESATVPQSDLLRLTWDEVTSYVGNHALAYAYTHTCRTAHAQYRKTVRRKAGDSWHTTRGRNVYRASPRNVFKSKAPGVEGAAAPAATDTPGDKPTLK
ncbi:unnamed protein product [Rangifer tarandus platyrhynchus]|uniref:Uncharacterized protein n=1 Tax=Rangifer tarandus platyrhynchus TaxID=3082113 RepID=A0ABN8XIX6_RANTA|nr:unnamed protein product [Rangifer tarandus platyrhynchus]